jgi:eukaryotic-like serine/threonine-protein kinase
MRRRQPKRRGQGGPKRGTGEPGRWRMLLWLLPVVAVVPFVIGYFLAVYVIFPPAAASGAGVPVPQLTGLSVMDAQAELVVAGLGNLDVTELPHPSAAPGVVIAQSPLPGQQLRPGAGVRVAISRGRPRVLVPDVQGFAVDRALLMLRNAGFDVEQATQESPLPAGRVLRTEPVAGEARMLPASVTLVVSAGPPPEPEPVPPDTLFAPPGR